MEKFDNFKKKLGEGARKLALGATLATVPLGAGASAQDTRVAKLLKKNEEVASLYEKGVSSKELARELFTKRQIFPNQGVEFLKKVELWEKKYTEDGPNHQALMKGWGKLAEGDLKKVYEITKREGVPFDMVFLALAESHWDKKAKSSAGAVGPWQFMPDTANRFGLKDRTNVAESTEAACKYLRFLYELAEKCAKDAGVSVGESDLWSWAFLAYNRGEGHVLSTPKGKKGDFFDFHGDINEYIKKCKIKESINYPTKIMGIANALEKIVFHNGAENIAKK